MPKLTIDGLEAEVEDGTSVLDAARALGIKIPTLCEHRALAPYGACRVCLVEVGGGHLARGRSTCYKPASAAGRASLPASAWPRQERDHDPMGDLKWRSSRRRRPSTSS